MRSGLVVFLSVRVFSDAFSNVDMYHLAHISTLLPKVVQQKHSYYRSTVTFSAGYILYAKVTYIRYFRYWRDSHYNGIGKLFWCMELKQMPDRGDQLGLFLETT